MKRIIQLTQNNFSLDKLWPALSIHCKLITWHYSTWVFLRQIHSWTLDSRRGSILKIDVIIADFVFGRDASYFTYQEQYLLELKTEKVTPALPEVGQCDFDLFVYPGK